MNANKTIECWNLAKVIIADITFAPDESKDVIREVIDVELDKYSHFYPNMLESRGITILEWEEFTNEIKTLPMEDLNSFIAWVEFISVEENAKMLEGKGVPIRPDVIYKDNGWKGWKDWVGEHDDIPGSQSEFEIMKKKKSPETKAIFYTRDSTGKKSTGYLSILRQKKIAKQAAKDLGLDLDSSSLKDESNFIN